MDLDVVVPVYNEGETIAETLQEIYREISPHVNLRLIVVEDGSTDNTKQILRSLTASLPMVLDLRVKRRGYSRAFVDGLRLVEAPYCLALDTDGQCDPKDFWQFWERRAAKDVLGGWRLHREDMWYRTLMSKSFKMIHALLFRTGMRDPGFAYLLIHRRVLDRLVPEMGCLPEGLWWEFTARAARRGFAVADLPVHHRRRAVGTTRVYKLANLPGIAARNLRGLWKVYREI